MGSASEQEKREYAQMLIYRALAATGYIDVPGVGRLRAGGLSHKGMVIAGIINLVLLCLFSFACVVRVARVQGVAAQEQVEIMILKQRINQQVEAQNQLGQCMTTVVRYETTLARYQTALNDMAARVQAAAPVNPQAEQMLKLLTLLKAVL
jgi:hypothetical protein